MLDRSPEAAAVVSTDSLMLSPFRSAPTVTVGYKCDSRMALGVKGQAKLRSCVSVITIEIDSWFCGEQDRWLMKWQEQREWKRPIEWLLSPQWEPGGKPPRSLWSRWRWGYRGQTERQTGRGARQVESQVLLVAEESLPPPEANREPAQAQTGETTYWGSGHVCVIWGVCVCVCVCVCGCVCLCGCIYEMLLTTQFCCSWD